MPHASMTLHASPAIHFRHLLPACACGLIALLGVATFAVACTIAQFLRPDYNWLGIPLSFYVIGSWGGAVEAGFFALAPGLAATGVGWYLALDRRARSAAPLLLFAVAAIALCVTAVEYTDLPNGPPTLHGYIHIVAAATTFLCVTVAMLLQSLRLRHDPRWRSHRGSALAVAAVAFVALWLVALVPRIPRGLGEKIVIALILAWLWRSGWWLLRRPGLARPTPPVTPGDRRGTQVHPSETATRPNAHEGSRMTGPRFQLRRGTPADAHALWAIRADAIRRTCRGHYPDDVLLSWAASPLPPNFAADIERKHVEVGLAGTQVAGFAILNSARAEIEAVFVAPDQGRRGLGQQLLARLECAARAAGLRELHLDASLNAVPFYLAAGYKSVSNGIHTTGTALKIACTRMEKRF